MIGYAQAIFAMEGLAGDTYPCPSLREGFRNHPSIGSSQAHEGRGSDQVTSPFPSGKGFRDRSRKSGEHRHQHQEGTVLEHGPDDGPVAPHLPAPAESGSEQDGRDDQGDGYGREGQESPQVEAGEDESVGDQGQALPRPGGPSQARKQRRPEVQLLGDPGSRSVDQGGQQVPALSRPRSNPGWAAGAGSHPPGKPPPAGRSA
jgi:hypothetical protein